MKVYANPEVQAVIDLHQDLFNDEFKSLSVIEQLDLQAKRILEGHQNKVTAIATHVMCWHPSLIGHSVDQILAAEFTLEDARETIAREYGFDNWQDVINRGTESPNPKFEQAVDAILAGDAEQLKEILKVNPDLIHERSSFGHGSTLLHYVGCNGVETYRQVVPYNLAEIAKILLEAGADVNSTANMYAGDCTTIGLLITSGFPAEIGLTDEIAQVLIDAGAETD